LNIESYIRNHPKLDIKGGSGSEARCTCPIHGSNRGNATNFSVNVETGLWLCRSPRCGARGSFPLLFKILEGIQTWAEVRARLDRSLPIQNWDELLSFQTKRDRAPEVRYQELPDPVFHSPITKENFPQYLRNRGYDESLLSLGFDLRLCFGGDYRNRILFPFYDFDDQLVTFTARLMDDSSHDARYRFPEGASTNQFLYGVNRLSSYQKIETLFLVEGQFDVARFATLGEAAVGISKGIISNRQLLSVKKIAELYRCEVIACLDRGAFDQTQAIWVELRSLGVKSRCVDISDVAKDPDGLTSFTLMELKSRLSNGQN
jgi:hypothetical protein